MRRSSEKIFLLVVRQPVYGPKFYTVPLKIHNSEKGLSKEYSSDVLLKLAL